MARRELPRRRTVLRVRGSSPFFVGADFQVTGTLGPDATGYFFAAGTYGGQPAFQRQDGAYWIYYIGEPLFAWYISTTKGHFENTWKRDWPVAGEYAPQGTNTGTATVTEMSW